MLKHGLIAGLVLAVPVLAFAPRGAGVATSFVPIAHADDAAPTDAELAGKAWDVLNKHCVACHGEGKAKNRAAAIDKNSYKKLVEEQKKVVPGKPDESPVYTTMIDHDDPMPPKKVTVRPTDEEIATIKAWIEKGAPAWSTEDKPADK